MQHTFYHSVLRITSLTIALMLLFDSGLVSDTTKQLSYNAQQYVATAIGMNASVLPTNLNQVTAALTEQKQELTDREAAIQEREIAIGLNTDAKPRSGSDTSTLILSLILFILLVLILLNYTLDYIRYLRDNHSKQVA